MDDASLRRPGSEPPRAPPARGGGAPGGEVDEPRRTGRALSLADGAAGEQPGEGAPPPPRPMLRLQRSLSRASLTLEGGSSAAQRTSSRSPSLRSPRCTRARRRLRARGPPASASGPDAGAAATSERTPSARRPSGLLLLLRLRPHSRLWTRHLPSRRCRRRCSGCCHRPCLGHSPACASPSRQAEERTRLGRGCLQSAQERRAALR